MEKIKNTKKLRIVLFLINVISTYLNTFDASFKKFWKTVIKGLQRNSIQFGYHIFLNVFNILKSVLFDGSFHHKKGKKSAGEIWGE
jgi:hypothetical protein